MARIRCYHRWVADTDQRARPIYRCNRCGEIKYRAARPTREGTP